MSSDKRPVRSVFASVSRYLAVPDNVRLRREHFGGIAFNTLTGTIIELDREAMAMLQYIREAGPVREDDLSASFAKHNRRVHKVIEHLVDMGTLAVIPPTSEASSIRANSERLSEHWPKGPQLTAPETVHWALTYRCDSHCPDCYARRHGSRFASELDTENALRVVDMLAQWGVFQLAIGGGEPLLRPDLATICDHAKRHGLVVHVTTGYHEATREVLQYLAGSISVLQVGVNHEKLLADPRIESDKLSETVRNVRDMGIRIGANLMLSNTVMANFEHIIELLLQAGLERITLLRYKPPADQSRWNAQNPTVATWRDFEQRLPDVLDRHREVTFRIDCALSFLQRRLKSSEASTAGIRGCVAGNRILALAPDGSVFPCSQLVHPTLRAGNLLTDDPKEIWMRSSSMKDYRTFRNSTAFKESWCGVCGARDHCGGCRVFAHDGIGGEPECVEPLIPPLDQLEKSEFQGESKDNRPQARRKRR